VRSWRWRGQPYGVWPQWVKEVAWKLSYEFEGKPLLGVRSGWAMFGDHLIWLDGERPAVVSHRLWLALGGERWRA
jgi:hypothetical protein